MNLFQHKNKRKQAEAQIRFQAQLLDAVEQAVIATDPEGYVIYWNPFAERLYGWSAAEAIGRRTLALIAPPDSVAQGKEIMAALQTGQGWSGEYLVQNREGRQFPVQMTISPVFDDQGDLQAMIGVSQDVKVLGSVMDITEQKRAEFETNFLANAVLELVQFESTEEINDFVAQKIAALLQETAVVTVANFDHRHQSWQISAIAGLNPTLEEALRLLDLDLKAFTGSIKPPGQSPTITGKLTKLELDVAELTNGGVSPETGERLKHLLSLHDLYCIGFQHGASVAGNVTIVTTTETKEFRANLIEAFISQVSLFIHKLNSEQTLAESARKFRELFDVVVDPMFVHDLQGRILLVNEGATRKLGYTADELKKMCVSDFDGRYTQAEVVQINENLRRNGVALFESLHQTKDGRSFPVEIHAKIIEFEGQPATISIVRDITERKQVEETLRENEERYQSLFKSALTGNLFIARDGTILDANPKMLEMLGSPSLEATKAINIFTFEPLIEVGYSAQMKYCIETGQEVFGEMRYVSKWGKPLYVRYYFSPIRKDNEIIGVLGNVEDITRRKESEDALREALAEKEILLKEIHHRVKNNLQTISGLLYKQKQSFADERFKEICEDSISRVQSIALVHERIYQSQNLNRVSMAAYIPDFVNQLLRVNRQAGSAIALHIDAEEVDLPIDKSIPVALVLNELVTNSLKHAFPDGEAGAIWVECFQEPGGLVTLVVRDNGVGLPADFDVTNVDSLGLYLVYNIVTRQLGGTVEVLGDDAAEFVVKFRS